MKTTWSVNILVRMFIYLAEIWKNHIMQNGLDVFTSKAIELPMPEFYVVYTGSRKTRPDCLKLSRDLFHGKCADIELTVHMLYNGENKGDILDQYVSFTDQVDHFYKTYGRTQEAAKKEAWQAVFPEASEDSFEQIDVDADGVISGLF